MSRPRCRVAGRSTRAAAAGADARQHLDECREREARAVPRSRGARLAESRRRLDQELAAERSANEAYEAYRARGISRDGRRFGGDPPSPHQVPDTPAAKITTTDPDSRLLKAPGIGYVQGYNAQATVNEKQIVLAAEISVDSPDFGHLEPMVNATVAELQRAGVAEQPEVAVADAGSWHHEQMDSLAADGIQVLIAPDANKRQGARPGWHGGRYEWMRRVLSTELWPTALPNTLTDDRADVRAHQAQPQDEPLSPTRQVGRPHAMAPDDRHPQPHQAPQPHPRGRHRVNRAAIAPTTIEPDPPTRHRRFPRQPPSRAGVASQLVETPACRKTCGRRAG